MKLSSAGLALIQDCEGYHRALPDGSCTAYQEVINGKADIPTIGWGCTKGVTMGLVWTREQAEVALRAEIEPHEERVLRLATVALNQNQFDALVSFDYNTGGLTLADGAPSGVLRALNTGGDVPAELARWNKFGGQPSKGLTARRAREIALLLTPVEPVSSAYMPQDAEPAKPPVSKATVATVAAGSGVLIPAVPTIVTESTTNAEAWQAVGNQAAALVKWAVVSPLALAVLAVMSGLLLLPKFWRPS